MARDYDPLIARAIAGFDERTAEARNVVYDHARTVLVRQLRDANHGLSTGLKELDTSALHALSRQRPHFAIEIDLALSSTSPVLVAAKNQEFVMAHGLIDRRTGRDCRLFPM